MKPTRDLLGEALLSRKTWFSSGGEGSSKLVSAVLLAPAFHTTILGDAPPPMLSTDTTGGKYIVTPYQTFVACATHSTIDDDTGFVVLFANTKNCVHVGALRTVDGKQWNALKPMVIANNGDAVYISVPTGDIPEIIQRIILGIFLRCTSGIYTKTLAQRNPIAAKKALKMLSRKRLPQWEWRVVNVEQAAVTRSEHKGGTHASPREHTRRGHFRTYKSGKRVWVQDMVVGKKELGRIGKEYVIREEAK